MVAKRTHNYQECLQNSSSNQECNKTPPTKSVTYLWQRWHVLGRLKNENFFFRQAKQTCKTTEEKSHTFVTETQTILLPLRNPSHLPPDQLLVELPILELNVDEVSTGSRGTDAHDLCEGQLASGYLVLYITALRSKQLDESRANQEERNHNYCRLCEKGSGEEEGCEGGIKRRVWGKDIYSFNPE